MRTEQQTVLFCKITLKQSVEEIPSRKTYICYHHRRSTLLQQVLLKEILLNETCPYLQCRWCLQRLPRQGSLTAPMVPDSGWEWQTNTLSETWTREAGRQGRQRQSMGNPVCSESMQKRNCAGCSSSAIIYVVKSSNINETVRRNG